MDGISRALNNIRVEQFWRSLKYKDTYIKNYRIMYELKDGLSRFMKFYNSEQFHQSLEYETADAIYGKKFKNKEFSAAA
jgi:putative transposase